MKKLLICSLALMAVTATAKAELYSLWSDSNFFSVSSHHDALPPNSSTQFLASLTSDRDNTVNKLSTIQNTSGSLLGLLGEDGTNKQVFSMSQINSADGATLVSVSGRNAVILKGSVNSNQEGVFTVKYLTNGLFMSYKSCNFNLKHDSKGFWIQNAYTGAAVSSVHVTTTAIGISAVEGLCP